MSTIHESFHEVLDRLEKTIQLARSIPEEQLRDCSREEISREKLLPDEFRIGDFIIRDRNPPGQYWHNQCRARRSAVATRETLKT